MGGVMTGVQYATSRRISLLLGAVIFLTLTATSVAQAFTPTTTLQRETENNTSAASSFLALANGNAAPANVSKSPARTLLYSGNTTKIFAHFMGWFGSPGHMNVGYVSNDQARVHRQVWDMKGRGINGAILDWYGPERTVVNQTAQFLRTESELQGFQFAIAEDVGSVNDFAGSNACDVTDKLISDLNYAYTNYETSSAYLRINGQPVVFFFGVEAYFVDWARVRSQVTGNPLFIFRNPGAMSDPAADGGFAWIQINRSDPYDMQLSYLDSFYTAARAHPDRVPYGSAYLGFNDTLAGWNANRVMHRQCARTWMATFAEAGKYYSSTTQLKNLQIATWNDYDEGTEIETGIDNCLNVIAWTSGGVLYWKLEGEGTPSSVSYFRIYISSDGFNLAKLTDVSGGTRSLSLSGYSLSTATLYTLYVKAIGKPSIQNHMSNAVAYRRGDAVPVARLSLSKSSGAVPLTVTASTSASTDADGRIARSTIDFGDGAVLSGPTATHTYQSFDKYTVHAYVYDNAGAVSIATATVNANPATSGVVISQPTPGSTVPNRFRIAAYASAGLLITTMKLYINGTKYYTIKDDRFDTTVALPDGKYTVGVNAWDSSGAVYTRSQTVYVGVGYNNPPSAVLTLNTVTPAVGTTVRACTAGSSDSSGIARSVVNFGDGSSLQVGTTTYHAYAAPGSYTVTATITDVRGKSSTTTSTVLVRQR